MQETIKKWGGATTGKKNFEDEVVKTEGENPILKKNHWGDVD